MPPRIAVVAGTRPEFIKLSKVVEELRRRGVEPTIVSTGQHQSLLRGTPAESTMAPQVSLGLPSENDPLKYAQVCESALVATWAINKPDVIVVQGDTASAYAGAKTACELDIPVAHVEAGIRSGDELDPWPEESFRISIDQNATWLFCATRQNFQNLVNALEAFKARGSGPLSDLKDYPFALLHPSHTRTTGNPGIDALYAHTQPTTDVVDRVLITLHRRESFGEPLRRLIYGLVRGAARNPQIEFVWPTHPNPNVLREIPVATAQNLTIGPPMDSLDFARQLSTSRAVITDSGGVQEEACALGVPCIVAREKTDRPESVEIGLAKVVGRTEQGILDGLDWAIGFDKHPDPSHCFGDGHASPRIVQHLLDGLR